MFSDPLTKLTEKKEEMLSVKEKQENLNKALVVAAKQNLVKCAQILLDAKADVNYRTEDNYNHNSVIAIAARHASIGVFKLLMVQPNLIFDSQINGIDIDENNEEIQEIFQKFIENNVV